MRRVLIALAATGLGACANTPGTETAENAVPQRSGVLFVERQLTSGSAATAHVGARFVQYVGLSAQALPDLIGMPRVPDGTSGCVRRADSAIDNSNAGAEARLLDVGAIDVHVGERAMHLEPRRFPDLWNVVSGVIYGMDGEWHSGAWRFSAAGSTTSRVAGFDIEARAPEDLTGVTVGDQALTPDSTLAISRRGVAVRWARGEHDDAVVVAFEAPPAAGTDGAISCIARDDGSLDIDATWADRIADLVRDSGSVTVHRIRATSANLASMDSARVVFDLSVRGAARAE